MFALPDCLLRQSTKHKKMNLINKTKIGDCSRCPETDTEVRKRGKDLVCLHCCKVEDTEKQMEKAKLKSKVRALGSKQKDEGRMEDAERSFLIQDLDYVFSRIVRLRQANDKGYLLCYTCGTVVHWSLAQCSHFIKRANTLLRFDFRNARAACKHCNEVLEGNIEQYKIRLEEEQPGIVETLTEQSREVHKWHNHELKEMLIDLRAKLNLIQNSKKIKP